MRKMVVQKAKRRLISGGRRVSEEKDNGSKLIMMTVIMGKIMGKSLKQKQRRSGLKDNILSGKQNKKG